MRKLLPFLMISLLIMPYSMAIDLGDLEWKDGKLFGKYVPSGMEGIISAYCNGNHIMDIVYRNDSIELDIKYFDNLEKIIERNPFLKDEFENSIIPLNIRGSSFHIEYAGCIVELHDVPTRFLRVEADKVVISNMNYNVTVENEHSITLTGNNFSAILISDGDMEYRGGVITAYDGLMLASFAKEDEKLEDSIKNRTMGGELTIMDYSINDTDYISYFGNVSVTPVKITDRGIILHVTGDHNSGGKILKINLGKRICRGDFKIKFDGITVKKADNFDDILNPDDDGIMPEYYNISTEEGKILLITIPHFSQHSISIEFVKENLWSTVLAIAMGLLFIMLAAAYMFKK